MICLVVCTKHLRKIYKKISNRLNGKSGTTNQTSPEPFFTPYIGLSDHRNQPLGQQVTAAQQPDVKQSGQQERFCTCLFEFLHAGVRTQGSHGHGQHECIDVFNGTVQRNFLHAVHSEEVLQQ